MQRAHTRLKRLFTGLEFTHGTNMRIGQRWMHRWRNEWPAKQLAVAVEALVCPSSPDPIVGAVQTLLAELGYPVGPVDGFSGPQTRAAICQFQQDRGLEVAGEASDELRFAACTELRRRTLTTARRARPTVAAREERGQAVSPGVAMGAKTARLEVT